MCYYSTHSIAVKFKMVVPVGKRTRNLSSSSRCSCAEDGDLIYKNDMDDDLKQALCAFADDTNSNTGKTPIYKSSEAFTLSIDEKEIAPLTQPETNDISGDDPWDVTQIRSAAVHCHRNDVGLYGKARRALGCVGKAIAVPLLLYLFICSLDFLASAFRLLGGKAAGQAFSNSELIENPICGLMIGILATVLVQSSSTSTSIVITMVAAGLLDVSKAVPIIMGANIGTSVTNTIVSMAQSGDRVQFQRAFAGATVHDMFNWLSVAVLLPLEIATGYLYRISGLIVDSIDLQSQDANRDFLKVITKPFTELVVMLDKKVIEGIAINDQAYMDKSLLKKWCIYEEVTIEMNVTIANGTDETNVLLNSTELQGVEKCDYLLARFGLGDTASGILLLIFSLLQLCTCLVLLVKILNSILQGRMAKLVRRFINSELPGCCSYFTGYVAIFIGACMTILVQSSSVFTSALTPLVGMGVIHIERMYPLTLGSNIGTTATGMLAALAAPSDKMKPAIQIALVHLLFNISGILIFYPIPKMRWPISMAKKLGEITAKYRWFAILYLIVMFFIIPGLVFMLSVINSILLVVVLGIVLLILTVVVVLNVLQSKRRERLPTSVQTWEFLPQWMHSLEPLDAQLRKIVILAKQLCPCKFACFESNELETEPREEKELNAIVVSSKPSNPANSLFTSHADDLTLMTTQALLIKESIQQSKSTQSVNAPESGYVTQNVTPCVSVLPSRTTSFSSVYKPS